MKEPTALMQAVLGRSLFSGHLSRWRESPPRGSSSLVNLQTLWGDGGDDSSSLVRVPHTRTRKDASVTELRRWEE